MCDWGRVGTRPTWGIDECHETVSSLAARAIMSSVALDLGNHRPLSLQSETGSGGRACVETAPLFILTVGWRFYAYCNAAKRHKRSISQGHCPFTLSSFQNIPLCKAKDQRKIQVLQQHGHEPSDPGASFPFYSPYSRHLSPVLPCTVYRQTGGTGHPPWEYTRTFLLVAPLSLCRVLFLLFPHQE